MVKTVETYCFEDYVLFVSITLLPKADANLSFFS